jgi:hypothetical protein
VQGHEIINSGRAIVQLKTVNGQVATGEVLNSNQISVVPTDTVQFKLLPYDMAEWKDGNTTIVLCSLPPNIDSTNEAQTRTYYTGLSAEAKAAREQCGA